MPSLDENGKPKTEKPRAKSGWLAGQQYLEDHDYFKSDAMTWGKEALQEVSGGFLDMVGLSGLANKGIDAAFEYLQKQIDAEKAKREKDKADAEDRRQQREDKNGDGQSDKQERAIKNQQDNALTDPEVAKTDPTRKPAGDTKVADTINFYGMDPKKVMQEINRSQNNRSAYTSRYKQG